MTPRPTRIGIIKPCCIGDAVMSLPAIASIHQTDPQIHIQVWTGEHSRPVFERHPAVDSIVPIPSVPNVRDFPKLVTKLRRQTGTDGYILLDRSRLLAEACRLAGANVMGTVRGSSEAIRHETDIYLMAVAQAGFAASTNEPAIRFTPAEVRAAQTKAGALDSSYVVLHPGGAENPGVSMHSKRWPARRWKDTLAWLGRRGIEAVLTGSPNEADLCAEIAAGTEAVISAGKLSLMESAALASASRVFVGPDTGLAHLAAAGGAPVIAIFGPTNPRQYAPRGQRLKILAPEASWRLPGGDLRRKRAGPVPSTSEVPVSAVVDALEAILGRTGDRSS